MLIGSLPIQNTAPSKPGPWETDNPSVPSEPGSGLLFACRGPSSGGHSDNHTNHTCIYSAWLRDMHPTNLPIHYKFEKVSIQLPSQASDPFTML